MIRNLTLGIIVSVFASAAGVMSIAWAQSPGTHHHSFSGAEGWAHIFDDPARDKWQKPHQVIEALALAPNATVADIGSGTGYFSVRLANMVPKGRVYGVDIEPDMVKYLADRAKRERLHNLTSIAGTPDNPRLPERVDLVLMVDVYHHVENRTRYFRNLRASLKEGGRIAIIDFTMESPQGPPKTVRIEPDKVKAELQEAGYGLVHDFSFLPDQYFLIFQAASS